MEYKGTFLGKRLLVYNESEKCPEDVLLKEYGYFDKIHLLRYFSDLSTEIFNTKGNTVIKSDISINVDFINYCILLTMKYSDGDITDIDEFKKHQLLKISFPWYQSGIYNDLTDINKILVVTAYRQFVYQESKSTIARSVYIYKRLWQQKFNDRLNIDESFQELYGISYDKILFYGLALSGGKESYFFDENYRKDFSTHTSLTFQESDFDNFIKFAGTIYKEFMDYHGSLQNPVFKYPILKTDFIPEEQNRPVYLTLSKPCLYNKIIYGIYFDLVEKYACSNRDNKFKAVYGYVFQEYIGILLKKHFKKWNIIPEIKYKKGKSGVDSVDWFVKRGDNLVLIEVKQSSIYLSAKNSGNIGDLKKGIDRNIINAINQLSRTEEDILSKEYNELYLFKNIKNIQKMIIIGDPLYYGNFIVNELFDNILKRTKTHIININDFESLLGYQGKHESMFYLLKSKIESGDSEMDFTEYLYKKYGPNRNSNNKFLIKIFEEYMDSWNMTYNKEED